MLDLVTFVLGVSVAYVYVSTKPRIARNNLDIIPPHLSNALVSHHTKMSNGPQEFQATHTNSRLGGVTKHICTFPTHPPTISRWIFGDELMWSIYMHNASFTMLSDPHFPIVIETSRWPTIPIPRDGTFSLSLSHVVLENDALFCIKISHL